MEHLGEDAKKALPDLAVLHSDLGSSVANQQVGESVLILGGIKPQSQPGGGGGLEGDHALRKIFKGRDLSGKPMDAQRQLDVRGRAGQPAPVTKSDSANRDEESEKLANDPTAKDKSVELDRAGDMQRKWAGRFFADEKKEGALREQLQRFYQRIKPTEEWVENDYYRLRPEESTRDRLTINGFWLDYANLPPGDRFLSNRFPQAHRNFSEVVLALALIDLPSKAKENKIEFAERSMNWTIGGPMIMFHQQIRPALFDRKNTTILVSENFFQKSDRYRFDNNLQFDKFISEKFSTHTLYGGQVVITNPTSTPQIVQLLIQIPEGAIAASGSQETRTVNLQLPAFNSQSFEYYFYFPTAGQFTHYPAHVADSQRVLSTADALGFNVVDEPVKTDLASWEYISQNGTADEVVEFLGRENLIRLDLSKIAFRMGDPKFFERIVSLLRERHVYNHDLWSYSMKHNVPVAIREFLSHADNLLQQCGMSLQSELLNIDPVVRKWYEQREFWPLVNIRAHEVGRRREILNSRIYNQYHQLLSILSYRTKLNSDDQLAVVYYLLLQDRVAESLERHAQVNPDELASRVQYDYCAAYLKMYEERPGEAAAIANKYVSYPVDHWQKRFAAVAAQVSEIGGADTQRVDADNNAQLQTVAAATSESFQFEVADGSVSLDYENLDRVTLSIYEMDAELLFSRNPFTTSQQSGFSMIRPNATQVVSLDPKGKKHKFDLPAEFKNRNVLVEIGASEQSKSQAVYANDLNVQVMEAFGQLKATAKSSSDLLPKTYVKVYAQRDDGSVIFFKDGYTDLRGRFDYVTQSNIPLDGIQQLALLILSDDHGTVIRTVGLPKE